MTYKSQGFIIRATHRPLYGVQSTEMVNNFFYPRSCFFKRHVQVRTRSYEPTKEAAMGWSSSHLQDSRSPQPGTGTGKQRDRWPGPSQEVAEEQQGCLAQNRECCVPSKCCLFSGTWFTAFFSFKFTDCAWVNQQFPQLSITLLPGAHSPCFQVHLAPCLPDLSPGPSHGQLKTWWALC